MKKSFLRSSVKRCPGILDIYFCYCCLGHPWRLDLNPQTWNYESVDLPLRYCSWPIQQSYLQHNSFYACSANTNILKSYVTQIYEKILLKKLCEKVSRYFRHIFLLFSRASMAARSEPSNLQLWVFCSTTVLPQLADIVKISST